MPMTAADWLPYALPLHRPWHTAVGEVRERRGRLLRLTDDAGRTGWGDCAPLPEAGIDDTAAEAFAEECALLDLAAQRGGLPLADWLRGEPATRSLAVNAVFGPICTVDREQLAKSAATGFRVIKLKVGVAPLADEVAALHRLAAALPAGLRLRLDANRAWTAIEARDFIAACAGLPIDGLEEPVAGPTPEILADLQSTAGFPLAIDETVNLLTPAFFRHPPVDRLVLKPARLGLLASVEIALRARAVGIEVVITDALDSACGRLAAAHLAAAVAPDAVHGLSTGHLFARDTGLSPRIADGCLHLPSQPGLGFSPGPAAQ